MLFSVIINILLPVVLADSFKNHPLSGPDITTRIVGGNLVEIEDFPYIVTILNSESSHVCGGSIISKNYILTAAHCLYEHKIEELKVRCGSKASKEGGKIHKIEKSFVHPLYNHSYHYHDAAILKLATDIEFNAKSRPIKLVEQNETIPDGTRLVVSGWGEANLKNESAEYLFLRALNVSKFNKANCQQIYYDLYKELVVTEANICAGFLNDGKEDICIGDSGGPLIIEKPEKLVGIVSFHHNNECSTPGYPAVYTRIATIRDWIGCLVNLN